MKITTGILFLFVVSVSCGSKDTLDQIRFIDGYWEIKSVEMADGSTKEFTVNTSIDFIEVKGDSGVRKKLMPRLDGSFRAFPSSESFTFSHKNGNLLMYYKTPYASWVETVLKANDSLLIVKNKDGKKFVYRRFDKIELEE